MRHSGGLRLSRIPRFEGSDIHHGILPTGGLMQTACLQPPCTRPRPGRRRTTRYHLAFSLSSTLTLTLLFLLLCCCGSVHAASAGTRPSRTQRNRARFENGDVIIFDERPAPQPALFRRAEASSIAAPAQTKTNHAGASSSTTSSTSTPSDTAIESAPTDSSAPPPRPFDGGLGTNYTQPSCPTFLKSMINNDTFTSCIPFSLLVQNSMSFFTISKSFSSITSTLDESCTVDSTTCSSLMSSFAQTLRSTAACSQDYQRENPIVRQAYAGLLSYDILHHASCLKNSSSPSSSSSSSTSSNKSTNLDIAYCFANAVTNLSSPTDSYIYYLPLGIPMPASSLPTCNECLKNTMDIFAAAASNKTQPLSLDYVNAAQQVNQDCGPGFVNGSVPNVGSSGSGITSGAGRGMGLGGAWFALSVGGMAIWAVGL